MVCSIAALGLVAGLAVAPATAAPLESSQAAAADSVVFAGGGTNLSNGYFFPGTLVYQSGSYQGAPPLQVIKGQDLTFVNLDTAAITNAHRIVALKRRGGRPLFSSDVVSGPGRTTILTSHLKLGVYRYGCPIHSGMYGAIEIIKSPAI